MERTLSKDTLFRVQNDYVAPKLAHELRQLQSYRADAGQNPTAAQRKLVDAQEAFVDELRIFLDDVRRIAPLWSADLDDGVLINFAPLWQLVSQYKPWQTELKSTWDGLAAGKFDWARLAMRLWPERVVPKCATDRSLAMAHGMTNDLWVENDDGRWKSRLHPTRPIDDLVRERTSIAIKAALTELTEATAASGPKTRTRRSA